MAPDVRILSKELGMELLRGHMVDAIKSPNKALAEFGDFFKMVSRLFQDLYRVCRSSGRRRRPRWPRFLLRPCRDALCGATKVYGRYRVYPESLPTAWIVAA